ncbi:anti-sigma factor, partial [Polaromonas sp.]
EPSAQLWARIEGSLQSRATRAAAVRRPRPAAATGWWRSVQLWRGLAGTGFAAAAVLAAVLVTRMGAVPPGVPAHYVVVLVAPGGNAPGWVVQASGAQPLSLIPVSQASVPADKTLQFWTKGDTWAAPVSLGLVKPGETVKVPLDKLPPLQPNQLFELTLEPPGGSPTGRPTGPIQFIGRAVKVV